MNEQTKLLRQVRAALWVLVAFAGIAAIGIAAFFGFLIFTCVGDDDSETTYTIVVARTNITAGSVLTKQILAKDEVALADRPKHFVCPHLSRALIGHRVREDLQRGDPIDVSKTDIWLEREEEPQHKNAELSPAAAASDEA
jgi:hypothetical protein